MSTKKGKIQANEGLPILFDGVDDTYSINSIPSFRGSDNQGTILVWIKAPENSGLSKQFFVVSNAANPSTYQISIFNWSTNSYKTSFVIKSGSQRQIELTTPLTPGNDYLIEFNSNGTANAVYLNGVVATTNLVNGGLSNGSWFNDIGASLDQIIIGFQNTSMIYQFCYLNRILTSEERSKFYNNGKPLGLNSLPKSLRQDITNFWNPKDKYTYKDIVGGLDLSANGNPQYEEKPKVIANQGLPILFDGVDDNYRINNAGSINPSDTQGALWAWFKYPPVDSNFKSIIKLYSSVSDYQISIIINPVQSNKLELIVRNGSGSSQREEQIPTVPVPENIYLVIFNCNGSTYSAKLNNITQILTSVSSNIPNGSWINYVEPLENVILGSPTFSSIIYQAGYLSGRAMTATEEAALYNSGTPLGLNSLPKSLRPDITNFWIPKDKYTYKDIVGGLDLSANGNPQYEEKPKIQLNRGLPVIFDGVDDYYSRNVTNFRSGDNAGTIFVWFEREQNDVPSELIAFCDLSDTDIAIRVLVGGDNKARLAVKKATGGGGGFHNIITINTLSTNTLYLLIAEVNGAGVKNIILNDVTQGVTVQSSGIGSVNDWINDFVSGVDQILIGCTHFSGGYVNFGQGMKNIQTGYSNQIFTTDEKTALYNSGTPLSLNSLPKSLRNKITNFWIPKDKYTYKDIVGGLDLSANGNPDYEN